MLNDERRTVEESYTSATNSSNLRCEADLRTEHAGKTLWKHLGDCQRIQMIETILGGFNE